MSALVHGAFAHRRKALAGSLALTPGFGPDIRERAREALIALGHPADERAERLSPGGVPGAGRAAGRMTPLATERAPAKLNLCLFLGPDARRRPPRAGHRL